MKLSEIQGQPRVVEALIATLAAGRLHHAWLFTGPRGVGKRTAAFALAAAANCEAGGPGGAGRLLEGVSTARGDACGACPSCIKIATGNHPDLHLLASLDRADELDLAGHIISEASAAAEEEDAEGGKAPSKSRRVITIRQVRALEAVMLRRPMEGRYKAAIVLDADQMNIEAANALLKTLEEPMGEALIVLTSSSPSRMPPTIPSRCQCLRFAALPEPLVVEILETRHGVERAHAEVLAHLSDGSVGRALALDRKDLADWLLDAIAGVADVPHGTASDALVLADRIRKGDERAEVTRRLLALFDVLGVLYRDAAAGAWADGWRGILGKRRVDRADAIAFFDLLDDARRALELNCGPQVTLESLFMKMRAAARPL